MDRVPGVDVMVDLETLDTGPDSVILSIGACVVDWHGEKPTKPFYQACDSTNQMDNWGRTESESTKLWWGSQPEEARRVFTDPDMVDLEQGLLEFRRYLGSLAPWKQLRVWGNGCSFDNVILTRAYMAIDVSTPWPFWGDRCFRTIKSELAHVMVEPERAGTHHNALDDALHQAQWLMTASSTLRAKEE